MTFGESLCDSARALLSCLRFPETYPSPNPKRVLVTQTLRQCSAGRTNIRSYRVAAAGRVNSPDSLLDGVGHQVFTQSYRTNVRIAMFQMVLEVLP
jgi:hypothetical protein